MNYLFLLGRMHEIAFVELEVVLKRFQSNITVQPLTEEVVSAEFSSPIDPQALMDTLGGTIKIMECVKTLATNNTPEIHAVCLELLKDSSQEGQKLQFAIAEFGRKNAKRVSADELKDDLKAESISARYVDGERQGLGAAQLLHHRIVELNIVRANDKTLIAKTVAIQDIDAWSVRDFDKPYRDPKKGMLPPKLARMMVNLAVGSKDPSTQVIFDPFCGSGTVLMEAMMLGAKAIGSDLDRTAVHGAGENLAWFCKTFQKPANYILSVQDATQVSLLETKERIDAIVTEPFLGRPNPKPAMFDNIIKGLEKMYLGVLKRWTGVLKKGGAVALVVPSFVDGERVKTLDILIDRLETLGYTREKGPLLYTRPKTVVQRNINVYRMKE